MFLNESSIIKQITNEVLFDITDILGYVISIGYIHRNGDEIKHFVQTITKAMTQ